MEFVHIEANRLSGTLPARLDHDALNTFRANFNKISGTIPPGVSGLSAIEVFDLNNNRRPIHITPCRRAQAGFSPLGGRTTPLLLAVRGGAGDTMTRLKTAACCLFCYEMIGVDITFISALFL